MVGLVVEEFGRTERGWSLNADGTILRIPNSHSVEVSVDQFGCPVFDFLIALSTACLEVTPIRWAVKGVLEGFFRAKVAHQSLQHNGVSPVKMV